MALLFFAIKEIFSLRNDIVQVTKKQQVLSVSRQLKKQVNVRKNDDKLNKKNILKNLEMNKKDDTNKSTKKSGWKLTMDGITYKDNSSIDTSKWKTFSSNRLGFSFEYPDTWDKLDVSQNMCSGKGIKRKCKLFAVNVRKGYYSGEFMYISFLGEGVRTDEDRESYIYQRVESIENENDLLDLCKSKNTKMVSVKKCNTYSTKNDIKVLKIEKKDLSGSNYEFYLYSPINPKRTIKFVPSELPYSKEVSKKIIENLIESIEFAKQD